MEGWPLSFDLNKKNYVGKVDWVEVIDILYWELNIIVKRVV